MNRNHAVLAVLIVLFLAAFVDHESCHRASERNEVPRARCERPAFEWNDGLQVNWTWR